jgi:hypothetical protein
MSTKEKIIQIIPAAGWAAVYTEDSADTPLDPIVCFALVECTKDGSTWQEVKPMGVEGKEIEFIDDAMNFKRVVYAPDRI